MQRRKRYRANLGEIKNRKPNLQTNLLHGSHGVDINAFKNRLLRNSIKYGINMKAHIHHAL